MEQLSASVRETLDANWPHRDSCLELIRSGEAVAFVGAGLSTPLGYPSWGQLLEKLRREAEGLPSFNPKRDPDREPLEFADEIKEHFFNQGQHASYRRLIGKTFMPSLTGQNHTLSHLHLAKLPFRAIVTTNYDHCIEDALLEADTRDRLLQPEVDQARKRRTDPCINIKIVDHDRHEVSRFLRSISENALKSKPMVAHLHGHWKETEHIILTGKEYAAAYSSEDSLHHKLAWSLFATRRVVFIGCSLKDPGIRRLLTTVTRDLWEFNEPVHFAILPLDRNPSSPHDATEREYGKCGIQCVFYDNQDGTFSELNRFLQEAVERTRIHQTSALEPMPRIVASGTETSTPGELTESSQRPHKTPSNAAWLEQVNQASLEILEKYEN